jgi:short-subunit dehydrogenase
VALVVGGSSGIGAALARQLAAQGAQLLVHGRDPERTETVANATGGVPLTADLDSPAAAADLARTAHEVHGRVDLLVVSAGIGWSGAFVDMGQDAMQHLVTLDLLVPIALTRALLPAMVTRGVGHVALVGSVAGRTGVAGEAVYAATKAGLDVFAESLRLELTGSGVGVTLVVPGAVDTPFFTARGRPYDRRFPRPVHPDRVAAATVEAIRRDRPVVTVPRWLTLASVVRAAAPGAFRRLSARFGEPVRSGRRG